MAGGLLISIGAACLWLAAPVLGWERRLVDAAAVVKPVAEVRAVMGDDRRPRDERGRMVLEILSKELGRTVSAEEFPAAMASLQKQRTTAAAERLWAAAQAGPADFATRREASRLALSLATEARAAGVAAEAERWRSAAFGLAATPPGAPVRAQEAAWRATLWEAWGQGASGAEQEAAWRTALAELRASAERSPMGLSVLYRALVIAARLDDRSMVGLLAERVRAVDELSRLDRGAVGLTDRQRSWVERLMKVASGGALPAPPPP